MSGYVARRRIVNTMIESGNDYLYVNCTRKWRGDDTEERNSLSCPPDRRDDLEEENFLGYNRARGTWCLEQQRESSCFALDIPNARRLAQSLLFRLRYISSV